jgi:hypothetical protein
LFKIKEVAMVRSAQPLVAMFVLAAAVLLSMSGGCGSKNSVDPGTGGYGGGDDDASLGSDAPQFSSDDGTSSSGGGSTTGASSGFTGTVTPKCPAGSPLSCFVNMDCPNGGATTITGKVYDPAGLNPLQNVVVFVPNDVATLPAITPGTSTCSSCDTSIGDYVTFTFTGPDGSFTLKNVPTGTNVPLVLQIGKWRRVMSVAKVSDCGTTGLPSSGTGQARLPSKQSEGSLPQMALLTGELDDLGCFLTRMGIDASEYDAPQGGKRLDIYQGMGIAGNGPGLSNGTAGNCTNTSCPLWAGKSSFEKYDIVLLACEGDTFDAAAQTDGGLSLGGGRANVTATGKQALHDWLDEGGKVFATHFHYTWFMNGPPDFQAVANWKGYSLGTGTCNNCAIDTSFQGGMDFDAWLKAVGALSGTGINLTGVADSVGTVTKGTTDRWIYDGSSTDTKYLSFNTPIGGIPVDAGEASGKEYCGKAVFTDLHAGGAPSGDVPGACKKTALSAQEKALEYLFFDLSACVHDESTPPPPPPPTPK